MKFPSLLAVALWLCPILPLTAEERRGDQPDSPALSPAEQLKRFKVPPGFEVQLVASEPEIQKPVNLNFDAAGRLWVTGTEMYPWPAATDAIGNPLPDFAKMYEDIANAFGSRGKAPETITEGKDALRILSEIGADGRAKKIEVFADKLNIPTGIQPMPRKPDAKGDTAIVYSIPNIWRIEDTDGDGKADKREPLYEGFGYLDTHGMSSNYIHWIDGWIYGCHGFRNQSEIKDRNGNVLSMNSGNTYRFKPDGSKIEYFTHGQTNPFGLAFDPMGNLYSADSHSKPIYMLIRGGYYEGIGKQHDGLGFAPRITNDDHGSSAIAGVMYYADNKWPAEYHGNLFNGNPVTNRINRAKLDWHGSTPKATRLEDFVVCDDPWFRPVQVKLGPDGAMYIADFYNPIIGHYEVPLNDPRRDRTHGRIWRVVWKGGAKGESSMPDLSKLDAAGLLVNLENPNLEVRRLATNELVHRVGAPAVDATRKLLLPANLDTLQKSADGIYRFDGSPRLTWAHSPESRSHGLWTLLRLDALDATTWSMNLADVSPDKFDSLTPIHAIRILGEAGITSEVVLEPLRDSRLSDSRERGGYRSALIRERATVLGLYPSAKNIRPLVRTVLIAEKDDGALIHSLLIALRNNLVAHDGYAAAETIAKEDPAAAETIAEASLGLGNAESASFLLAHLTRSNFRSPRTGEYLRHAANCLPAERLTEILRSDIRDLSLPQRLAIADALSSAARKRSIELPDTANTWVEETMLAALRTTDTALLDKAISSVKDAKRDWKAEPLKHLVFAVGAHGPRRAAALEALMNLSSGVETATLALKDTSSLTLRKKAAELLAQRATSSNPAQSKAAHAALLEALPTAPGELAFTIGGGLAKTDASAEQLLALVEGGKVSPLLLRHRLVADTFRGRPRTLRDRAMQLTASLPPEDARIDGMIAKRVEAYRAAKKAPDRGQQLFQQQCSACHKVKNNGGNIGPNLDGMSARGVHRLIEDILDPNRNVDPAFRQTIIETTDGRTLAGANLRAEGDLVIVNDATGQVQSVPKAQIKSQHHSTLSLMPASFEQTLPEQDLHDLVAYLLSNQG